MRPLILLLSLALSVPAIAGELRIDASTRPQRLRFDPGWRLDRPQLQEHAGGALPGGPRSKAPSALNCENDNQIEPLYSLALLQGDLAGSFLDPPIIGQRYWVDDISIGLYDAGTNYPTEMAIQIFLYDGVEFFNSIGAFTATLSEPIAAAGEILSFDLRPFLLEIDEQVLVLFGQSELAGPPKLFPAADASPRCSLGRSAHICSVILPSLGEELFAYAFEAPAICAAGDPLLLADVVVELGISEGIVAIQRASFAAIKARY